MRDEALEHLRSVEHIIHAGDIGSAHIIARLEVVAPVTAIRGNVDKSEWAKQLPETAQLQILDRSFFIIHDRKMLVGDPAAEGIEVVISGHSHRPSVETLNGVLFLNPGSAGPRRFRLPVTLATLELDGEALVPRFVELV